MMEENCRSKLTEDKSRQTFWPETLSAGAEYIFMNTFKRITANENDIDMEVGITSTSSNYLYPWFPCC